MKEAKSAKASIMRSRKRHQEYFTLKEYGSKEKAVLAANKWISKLEKKLPARLSSKNILTSRNKSGAVGVRLDLNVKRKNNGKIYPYWRWIAFWPSAPSRGGFAWSINRYGGDKNAFVLAYLSREYESIDRNKILNEFEKIRNTNKYREILSLKKQSPS